MKRIRAYTDGGARGNPGPAGAGAVLLLLDEEGKEVRQLAEVSVYLGETTNNQAEYRAIFLALQKARELGSEDVEVRMDSELAARQLNGQYRVKNAELAQRYLEIVNLKRSFKRVIFKHVRRAQNAQADALVNAAIDQHLR